jgi:tetratricopeptide (TPR) repeat protein
VPGQGGAGRRSARWPDGAFVGRDDLLRELTAAADGALHGNGSIVLLTGEAGIGKTSVARALATGVRDDLAISWGTCTVDGSAPPFWPWRALLPVEPPSTRGDPHGDPAAGAQRFERLNALRDVLLERARQEPLLHVIEDLQWADVASVLLLAHLGPSVVGAPVLVVATLRSGEPLSPQLEDAIEGVRRLARVRELPPLADEDVGALVRGAGVEPDADLTALLQARTGGNPLFVTEVLRATKADLAERRLDALRQRVPSRVSELVTHRLARLAAPVAEVLVTASVVGAEGDARVLAAARGVEVQAILDLLDQARAAHLVDVGPAGRWQFRHELIRDAVYGGVTGTKLAQHHAAVLEALAADVTTPPPVIAHHALAAQPLFDADRAVALAARAGESAFAQHAYEEAVGWFRRALAAAPSGTSPRWRAELLVLCGEAHRHMGETEEARRALVAAAELTDDPDLLARAALGYADPGADLGIAYRTDDPVTGALLERALAAQSGADSVTAVLLEARLAAELYFSDEPGRSRDLACAAVDRARRLDDGRALGAATAVAHDAFVVGQRDLADQLAESQQLLEWARASGSSGALLTAHRARAFDLLAAGDVAGMDAEILAFRRIADPLRAPGYLWWPALWAAMRALLEGRHDEAERRALAAYEIGAVPFPTLAFTNLSFLLFFLRREQGRFGEMEQATRDYAASHADIPALRVALMFLLAEIGRVDEARAMLTGIDAAALDRLHDRNWPASWFQLARATALVGDRDLAATLLEDRHRPSERCVIVSLATVCLGATDLATAWLLHTSGDLEGADERYRAAATMSSRIGARGWLAQAHADHARLLLDRGGAGDGAEARRLTDLAAAAADDMGLASLSQLLGELRGRLDQPAPGEIPVALPGAPAMATFRRRGPVWELEFATRTAQLPHARGLSDLAFLLSRPGQAVSVLELADEVGSAPAGARGAPAFDERARREIRARLHELDAEEAEAEADGDGERAAVVRERRQSLAEAVARDFGLGGRSRRIGDPVERARKTVSTRIRRAITQVGKAHPELGRHLDRSIDTGAWCAYRPAEAVTWHT